jgi:hypothetical protein
MVSVAELCRLRKSGLGSATTWFILGFKHPHGSAVHWWMQTVRCTITRMSQFQDVVLLCGLEVQRAVGSRCPLLATTALPSLPPTSHAPLRCVHQLPSLGWTEPVSCGVPPVLQVETRFQAQSDTSGGRATRADMHSTQPQKVDRLITLT